jgi:hypothetical protein
MLGVSFVIDPQRLLPLTLSSLALALMSLAISARRSRQPLPLVVGGVCALGVWAGKFELGSDALTIGALLGLIGASLLARRGRPPQHVLPPVSRGSELTEHAEAR